MHTVKKTIEAEKVDHRPRKEKLCDLLHNYRATPPHIDRHTTSNKTTTNTPPPPKTRDSSIRDKDDASKRKMKENMDSKRYVEPTNLSEGDMVLAKREPSYKKLATPYDPNPHIVSQHKGAMIPAQRADKELTRN